MFLNSFKIIGILYLRKLICRFYKIKEHSYGPYGIYMGSLRIFSTFGLQIKKQVVVYTNVVTYNHHYQNP